jgi:hypothetical protein
MERKRIELTTGDFNIELDIGSPPSRAPRQGAVSPRKVWESPSKNSPRSSPTAASRGRPSPVSSPQQRRKSPKRSSPRSPASPRQRPRLSFHTEVIFEESLVDEVNALPTADEVKKDATADQVPALEGDASDQTFGSESQGEPQQPISDDEEEEEAA